MLNFYGTGNSSGGCCHFVIICQLSNSDGAKLKPSMCAVPGFNIHHLFYRSTVVSAREARNNQISPHPGPGKARIVKPLKLGDFLSERLHAIPWVKRSDQRCQFILGSIPWIKCKMLTNILTGVILIRTHLLLCWATSSASQQPCPKHAWGGMCCSVCGSNSCLLQIIIGNSIPADSREEELKTWALPFLLTPA